MKTIFLLPFLLLSSWVGISQLEFVRNDNIDVYQAEINLKNPWAGGINSAQVSRIDLNGDGALDLFVFDKVGNRILPFLNTNNTQGIAAYKHKYEYVADFPEMSNWVLLRDFNCDGLVDIFTNNFNGIRVYENTSSGGNLSFDLKVNSIMGAYNYSGTPFVAPVYCLSVDIPSIVDLDDDGDLDIITWSDNNVTVFYYENLGADIGNCDTLLFQLGNRCYGMITESSESSDIAIGENFNCDYNVLNPTKVNQPNNQEKLLHAGGTILNIDLDQNGLKDMIVSDVTDPTMRAALMQSSVNMLDSAFLVTENFPTQYQSTAAVDMALFPAGYYEDVDNDGIKDLLVSPNLTSGVRDYNSLWYFKNDGLNDLPQFNLQSEAFLQNTMIDVGRGALPVTVDFNNDGLMDMVVANQKAYTSSDNQPARLALYQNIGNENFPTFELVDADFLSISSLGLAQVYPTFGDLDGDSDNDLIVGDKEGKLYYFEHQGSPGTDPVWIFSPTPMVDAESETIDVGKNATPQLFDLDNDGVLDLIIGEENGNINYYHNEGNSANYSFTFVEDTIGDVVASNFLGIKGNSVPFMWRNDANEIQLLLGTETGVVSHYDNIENNVFNSFNLVELAVENINEGPYSAACLYDFTNDGKLDMLVGNVGGGLAFYQGGTTVSIGVEDIITPNDILSIYPNPAKDKITLRFDAKFNNNNYWRIYDAEGRTVMIGNNILTGSSLDLAELNGGVYFIVITNDDETVSSSFVIN